MKHAVCASILKKSAKYKHTLGIVFLTNPTKNLLADVRINKNIAVAAVRAPRSLALHLLCAGRANHSILDCPSYCFRITCGDPLGAPFFRVACFKPPI